MHNSQVAEWGNIYLKLEDIYNKYSGLVTCDSAFKCKDMPYLIKSSQDPFAMMGDSQEEVLEQVQIRLEATSMYQATEWEMCAFQSSFPHVKDHFLYEEKGERKLVLQMLILLYNFWARMVGINQIRNVYMSNLNHKGTQILDIEL